MEKIIIKRGAGKTTELIYKANHYNGYIVCRNITEAKRIMKVAADYKCSIHLPITYQDFIDKKYSAKCLFIDQADDLLKYIAIADIETITMSKEE